MCCVTLINLILFFGPMKTKWSGYLKCDAVIIFPQPFLVQASLGVLPSDGYMIMHAVNHVRCFSSHVLEWKRGQACLRANANNVQKQLEQSRGQTVIFIQNTGVKTRKIEYIKDNYSHMASKCPTCFPFLLNINLFPLASLGRRPTWVWRWTWRICSLFSMLWPSVCTMTAWKTHLP